MPSYLELAYNGNYVGRVYGCRNVDLFTYQGETFMVCYETNEVSVY